MIQHVAFEVGRDRWDACVNFYALLGFERVTPPPSLAERAAWVQHGPTQVHLMDVDEPVVLPRGHVAVVVDEYDATLAALRDAGHEVEARAEHWGSPRAYVHDPAGNLVELMAFPPDGPQPAAAAPPAAPEPQVAQPAPLPPANWYPDPSGNARLRYWDGGRWTDHTAQ